MHYDPKVVTQRETILTKTKEIFRTYHRRSFV